VKIAVVNKSTVVTDEQVALWTRACAQQLCEHVAVAWERQSPTVEFSGEPVTDGALEMYVMDDADQPGALGYHDNDPKGRPRGFVFAKTTLADGETVSVTLSHELGEMFIDPSCTIWHQTPDGNFRALELCDAVEEDYYLIAMNGADVKVSNFLLPAYFQDQSDGSPTDYMGKLGGKAAPAMTRGGYCIEIDSKGSATQQYALSWQDMGERKARRKSRRQSRTGRRTIRVKP